MGGGCELAIFCDVIIASEKAKFAQPEIAVGVYPPVAIAYLQGRCPDKFVYDFLLTGRTVKAEEALKVGLISRMVPDDYFEGGVEKYIKEFSKNSGTTLMLTKKALKNSRGREFTEALKIVEEIYIDELMETSDAHEGLNAFLEKREPEYKNC